MPFSAQDHYDEAIKGISLALENRDDPELTPSDVVAWMSISTAHALTGLLKLQLESKGSQRHCKCRPESNQNETQ